MDFNEFRESDFCAFFGVTEVGRSVGKEGHTTLAMKPGGFKEHIDISLMLNDAGDVREGRLALSRDWIGNWTSVNPFAKDIAKSFLYALIPRSDQLSANELIEGIWQLVGAKDKLIHVRGPPKPPTDHDAISALDCFMGHTEHKSIAYAGSQVSLVNLQDNKRKQLLIRVQIS